MGEYKILIKEPAEAQKVLNQWRHEYHITIWKVSFHDKINKVFMLVERKEKCIG